MPRRMGVRYERQPSRLEMKELFLTSVAALAIASSTANAQLAYDPPVRASPFLEPISKSPEEDNEASELYEAEEVLGVVFPTDEDAALPLNPSKEALHKPASHIAA